MPLDAQRAVHDVLVKIAGNDPTVRWHRKMHLPKHLGMHTAWDIAAGKLRLILSARNGRSEIMAIVDRKDSRFFSREV